MVYRDCDQQRAYDRAYYHNNKVARLAMKRKREEELTRFVRELKASTPCADCGATYPHYVMDFDHVRGEKEFDISIGVRQRGKRRLLLEIAKCELVCSNCHRERTFSRLRAVAQFG